MLLTKPGEFYEDQFGGVYYGLNFMLNNIPYVADAYNGQVFSVEYMYKQGLELRELEGLSDDFSTLIQEKY